MMVKGKKKRQNKAKERREATKKVLDKVAEKTKSSDVIEVLTFAGLTLAYKQGMKFLPVMFTPQGLEFTDIGADIGTAINFLTTPGSLYQELGIDIGEKAEAAKSLDDKIKEAQRELDALEGKDPGGKYARRRTVFTEEEAVLIQKARDKLNKLKALKREAEVYSWLMAMGFAGATIYFLKETTITELASAIDIL